MKLTRYFSLIGVGLLLACMSISAPSMAGELVYTDVLHAQPASNSLKDMTPYAAVLPQHIPRLADLPSADPIGNLIREAMLRPEDVSRLVKAKAISATKPIPICRKPPAD